jgi:IS30 family transposase
MQTEEREALAAMRLQGMSLRAIGSALGRSPGTVSCEPSLSLTAGAYASRTAHADCQARRTDARPFRELEPNGPAWPLVSIHLRPAEVADLVLPRRWEGDLDLPPPAVPT